MIAFVISDFLLLIMYLTNKKLDLFNIYFMSYMVIYMILDIKNIKLKKFKIIQDKYFFLYNKDINF